MKPNWQHLQFVDFEESLKCALPSGGDHLGSMMRPGIDDEAKQSKKSGNIDGRFDTS
jgi:hypothetical protein